MLKSASARTALVCLVLALGTLLVYAPARHFSFVNFDDPDYVVNNFNINQGLNRHVVAWAFNAGYASNWHPLTWISHALDCQWFGRDYGKMHEVNVLLHTFNAVLLFLTLQCLTTRPWRSALVAALFAWHPMHVESVAWISERKDVLSGFFFILTIWAYARYAREWPTRPRPAQGWFYGALGLFALGLLAKPMLVTLPCLLLLLDAWPLGRLAPDFSNFFQLLGEKIPFFVFSAVSCAMTLYAQARSGAVRPLAEIPLTLRVNNALVSCVRYIDKLVWPRNLSAVYRYHRDLPPLAGAGAALLLGLAGVLGVYWWNQRRYWAVGWLWFVGTLVPVIGIVQVGSQAMADRYSYLPSIGLFIAVCWLAADWVENRTAARVTVGAVAGAALAACLCLTRAQAMTWQDGGTLARQSIAVDPDSVQAHDNYAGYLLYTKQWEAVKKECEIIFRLAPSNPSGHEYLGEALFALGQPQAAAEQLRLAAKLDPFMHEAQLRLGQVCLALNKPEEAEEAYSACLGSNAGSPEAHYGLGKALDVEGKAAEAAYEFAAAVHYLPGYAAAHYRLGLALAELGRPGDALNEYAATIRLNPNDAEALNNLAWLLSASANPSLRNGSEAVLLAQRACALTTNREPLFIGTLADAYAEAGQFDKAIAAAQQAHDVAIGQSNDAVAARNLQLREIYQAHRAFHEE
jgi:tetratricopeptide (TPR) repeat protein